MYLFTGECYKIWTLTAENKLYDVCYLKFASRCEYFRTFLVSSFFIRQPEEYIYVYFL